MPLIAAGVIGWYYSVEILGPDTPRGKTGQPVLAHTDSTITLAATPKARRPGYWAIEWPGGYGRIGPLVTADDRMVVTRFQVVSGAAPDSTARLAGFAPDSDPRTWLGVEFEDVAIPSRIGELPSWLVPGRDSTWALFVHGRAAGRAEVLRMLPGYMALGLPCLVISYRNDRGAPRVGDGSYRLGATEWQDLEDAVRWARAHGARDVVVVGCSMGGGIVAQYLRRSSERSATRAAVLDAPALDWSAIIDWTAKQRRVPGAITACGKLVASLRSGIRWSDLSQNEHAREFATPMLILHGAADRDIPPSLSEGFAAMRPDLVTYHLVPGAGHVESVNVAPDAYAATIAGWLRERGIGRSDGVQ